MKINFNFDMDDWMAFQEDVIRNSKKLKSVRIKTVLLMFLIVGVFAYFDYKDTGFDWFLISYIALFVLIGSFFWFNFYRSLLKRTRKFLQENDNAGIFGNVEVIFDDKYILMKQAGAEYMANWVNIHKIVQNKNYFFIYLNSVSACVIPKLKIQEQNLRDISRVLSSKQKVL
jgi:preprotein translocase subunit YajC